MEVVTCYCVKCNGTLGRFKNSWNGILRTYFSPVHTPLSVGGLEGTGNAYPGPEGSCTKDSLLQDLTCVKCRYRVGLRCDDAPEGHLLEPGQLMLRLTTKITVVSERSGLKANIAIMKSIPLNNLRSVSETSRVPVSANSFDLRLQHPRLLPSVSRTTSGSSRHSTPEPSPPQFDIGKFKLWAEDAIKAQQQDIDRISGSVDRILTEMQLFKHFMKEMRAERSSNQQLQIQQNGEVLKLVREELDELRQQVNSNPARLMSREELEQSLGEIETLAQDVQLVREKTVHIEDLKRELEQLKERLHFMDDAANTAAALPLQRKEDTEAREIRLPRKRSYSQMDSDEPDPYTHQERLPKLANTKKRTESNCTSPTRKREANTRSQLVIEIFSSNATPPPLIPDEDDSEGQFTDNKVEEEGHHQTSRPSTPVAATRQASNNGTSNHPAAPSSKRILRSKNVIEPDFSKFTRDKAKSWKSVPDGVPLTINGNIVRRSLRHLNLVENDENRPASRSSLASETAIG